MNSNKMEKKLKLTRHTLADHLIEYQLAMVGKTLDQATAEPKWYSEWTMTSRQHDEFKAYAVPLISKAYRCSKTASAQTFSWFDLQYGLRIKD